ncbi:complex I subunit 4 family protein [Flindersiella endophytica]
MSILLWLILAVPLLGSLAVLSRRVVPESSVAGFGVVTSAVTLGLALLVAFGFDYRSAGRMQYETDMSWISAIDVRWKLGIDGISLPMVLLTTLLVFLCLLYTTRVRPEGGRLPGLVGLVLLLEVGMIGTFLALDLVVFFLFFEVVLIPMWFVIALWGDPHDEVGRRRAATTFILYTLLGSAVMLVGFLVVHAGTGTFDIELLADLGGSGVGHGAQIAAALAIGLGLAVKTPMWPLHSWLPDAHAKAPTIGSVLLAGVLLKMGTYGFIRVWLPVVPDGVRAVAPYFAAFATVGIVYGALACLAQRELKRLIAYSSVGHMGFVLLGITTVTGAGVNGAVFAGVAHGLITGLLFFLAGAVKDRHGTGELDLLGGGLYARMPRLGGLLAFGAVASLGLPGLAGFWGEMLALLGAYDPGGGLARSTYVVLMVVGGVGAVLTAGYFLLLVRRVCQGPPAEHPASVVDSRDVTPVELWAWAPLVVLTFVLGLYPKALLALTDPAVQMVLGRG